MKKKWKSSLSIRKSLSVTLKRTISFKAKQHYYVLGEEVTKEVWMSHLSAFGTPNYHGIVIDENGKSIQK